jgi:hypothetical protein
MKNVVDTNVPLVVRFPTTHPKDLADACEALLEAIIESGVVVSTDADDEIIEEYFTMLHHSGQPTLGDAFAKWVFETRWTQPDSIVDIHPEEQHSYGVLDGDDADFDPSDRKFIAVAKVAGATIHEATDTKWLDWGPALARHAVTVAWVHEACIRAAYETKFGRAAP